MPNQWLRLWHDMPNDPKWRTIARVSKQPITSVISVYLHVLVSASNATERGRTQDLCSEDIASALDLETSDVEAILAAMQGRVLEGEIVSGWDKRQPEREDGSAQRAKAWREKEKSKKERSGNNSERDRTQPNAEKRSDKDTDTDKEKKQEEGTALSPSNGIDPAAAALQENQKPELKIIAALDDAIGRSYGDGLRRSAPAPMDWTTARRWVDAGASVEAVSGLIDGIVARQHAKGATAPASLNYFEKAVVEALANPPKPLPDMSTKAPETINLPPDIIEILDKHPSTASAKKLWFEKCVFKPEDGVLIAPSAFVAQNIEERFGGVLNAVFGRTMEVVAHHA